MPIDSNKATRRHAGPLLAISLVAAISAVGVGILVAITGLPEPGTAERGIEDELSHMLLAQTFAEGRLTNAPHPLWRHFETQYVLSQPTYTSKYPPAHSLLMAIGIVVGGHPFYGLWLGLVLMCASVTWMFYVWLPPRWAMVAGIAFVLHLGIYSMWTYYYSGGGIPTVIGAALLLRGIRRVSIRPSVGIGITIGFALVLLSFSRPYESLMLALSAAAAFGWWLLRDRRQALSVKLIRVVLPCAIVLGIGGAAHLHYNRCVTGNPLQLPYQLYVAAYSEIPNIILVPRGGPPESAPPIMRAKWEIEQSVYDEQSDLAGFFGLLPWKLGHYWAFYLGPILSIPLIGLFRVRWRRWNLYALLTVLFVLTAVCLNFAMQVHYPAPVAPLIVFLVVQGLRRISHMFRSRRAPLIASSALLVLLTGLLFYRSFEYAKQRAAPPLWVVQRTNVRDKLLESPGHDLVIVTYEPGVKPHRDVIFNDPKIDESEIVWARSIDLASDTDLIKYFNDRTIWTLHIPKSEYWVAEPRLLSKPSPP
ncbi:MAG: hypothetical protein WD768_12190 [Phycisphaeraceae bacterium]